MINKNKVVCFTVLIHLSELLLILTVLVRRKLLKKFQY